jgi:restriction system protein
MSVPDFQSLMLPVLNALADGATTPLSEVRAHVASAQGLSPEDLREKTPGGRTSRFSNNVSWAAIYMERAGLVVRVRRGVYQLTEDGERLLKTAPERVDMAVLADYPVVP